MPKIVQMLKDEVNWGVREAAIRAFETLVSREYLPKIVQMLKDKSEWVRLAA